VGESNHAKFVSCESCFLVVTRVVDKGGEVEISIVEGTTV
jgi:hypothetical protein